MTAPRICVLGSANMDIVAFVDRAPQLGETLLGHRLVTGPGGKGANQAIAAARAGGRAAMVGAVGDDTFAATVREVLGDAGVDLTRLREQPGATGTAHITVDSAGRNSIVVIPSANASVTGINTADETVIAGSDVLLMQLELPMEAVTAGAAAARGSGTRVVLSAAPSRPLPSELVTNVDVLVVNEHEAAEVAGHTEYSEAVLGALLQQVPEVVVTLGGVGCVYGSRTAGPVRVPAPWVDAVDSTAAGDCFVGALSVALAERPVTDALRWAAAAAALSVQRIGASAAMPARAEIEEFRSALAEAER